MSEYEVKAAYLFSFAKFIEWPAQTFSSPGAPIRFCIWNDRAFQEQLNRIVKGKSISGHPVEVSNLQSAEQGRDCQLLFIDAAQGHQTRRIVEALRGSSVLVVGEAEDFLQQGGMINFVLQDDRVQFQINHKAATAAGLYISSRLLGVATRVVE